MSAYRSAARLFQGSHLPLLYIGERKGVSIFWHFCVGGTGGVIFSLYVSVIVKVFVVVLMLEVSWTALMG